MRELIVYATPTGALAGACNEYFEAASELGGTTAQTYPPHCTLTGFFHRDSSRIGAISAAVQHAIDEHGPVQGSTVKILRVGFHDTWVGLELEAPELVAWTERLAESLPPQAGEDALRCKTWLHLSLAYGVDALDPWRAIVSEHFAHPESERSVRNEPELWELSPWELSRWELGLWERTATSWRRLTH